MACLNVRLMKKMEKIMTYEEQEQAIQLMTEAIRQGVTMYALSAKQIREIDEIKLDQQSTDATLHIALNYHSNRMNSLRKREKEWWDDITEFYKLDSDKKWRANFNGPIACIEEVPSEDY